MRVCLVFGLMTWLINSSWSLGAEGAQPGQPPVPAVSDQQGVLQPVPADSSGQPLGEEPGLYCPQRRFRPYGKLLDKWASYGQFNCECSGSYKYPAPPQYTYHWPGMYSQPTMTQYMSPYRFPALKLPPKDEDILQPEEEEDNVSERITTRPIRPVSVHRPISR